MDNKVFDKFLQRNKVRHSFLLKSIWVFALIFKTNYGNNNKLGQTEGSHLIKLLKNQPPIVFRQHKRNLKNMMLLKAIKLMDFNK